MAWDWRLGATGSKPQGPAALLRCPALQRGVLLLCMIAALPHISLPCCCNVLLQAIVLRGRLVHCGGDPDDLPHFKRLSWGARMQLGAQVAAAPDHATTHVVAVRAGTDKVLWAREHGRAAVAPPWLHSCGTAWWCSRMAMDQERLEHCDWRGVSLRTAETWSGYSR